MFTSCLPRLPSGLASAKIGLIGLVMCFGHIYVMALLSREDEQMASIILWDENRVELMPTVADCFRSHRGHRQDLRQSGRRRCQPWSPGPHHKDQRVKRRGMEEALRHQRLQSLGIGESSKLCHSFADGLHIFTIWYRSKKQSPNFARPTVASSSSHLALLLSQCPRGELMAPQKPP